MRDTPMALSPRTQRCREPEPGDRRRNAENPDSSPPVQPHRAPIHLDPKRTGWSSLPGRPSGVHPVIGCNPRALIFRYF